MSAAEIKNELQQLIASEEDTEVLEAVRVILQKKSSHNHPKKRVAGKAKGLLKMKADFDKDYWKF